MEFCPKCGSMLLPKRVGRRTRGFCPHCGYKGKLTKPKAYKISKRGKGIKEVVVIERKREKRREERPEIVYEEMKPEYYEEYYE